MSPVKIDEKYCYVAESEKLIRTKVDLRVVASGDLRRTEEQGNADDEVAVVVVCDNEMEQMLTIETDAASYTCPLSRCDSVAFDVEV